MSSRVSQKHIVYLEGNIGAGKSSLLHALETHLQNKWAILYEPLASWQNICGQNLLQNFYREPGKWCFLLNTHIYNTLILRQQTANQLPLNCILERSGKSTSQIFVPYAHDNGSLTLSEFHTFQNITEEISSLLQPNLNDVVTRIYLRTPPEVSLTRIHQRGEASMELDSSNCSVEWLTNLHKRHDDWLLPLQPIILDGRKPLSQLVEQLIDILQQLS